MKQIKRTSKGFTLMETLLAVALVGLLVSIFLTVFVPSRSMVQEALTKQDAERIAGILRAEISTIRADERGKTYGPNSYRTPFDKGFAWLRSTHTPDTAIVIFSYRADLTKHPRKDGTYPPVEPGKRVPPNATQVVTIACPINDPVHKDEIRHAVGPAFIVCMTQLVPDGKGALVLAPKPGTIDKGNSPDDYCSKPDDKDPYGSVVFYRADFYLMYPPNPDRYHGRSWKSLGRPVFSSNLSFRR